MRATIIILLLIFIFGCNDEVVLPTDFYYPTQEELDKYGSKLLDLTIWQGNIALDGSKLSDPSFFDSIVEIDGSLTLSNWNHKNAFPNLEIVRGDDLNGGGFSIGSEIDTICLLSLKHVETNFFIANSETLKVISLPALETVKGIFFIADNPKLESIENLNSLSFLKCFDVQRNGSLVNISGNSTLEEIEFELKISPYRLNNNNGIFNNLKRVDERIFLDLEGDDLNLNWLDALENSMLVHLKGNVLPEDLCFMKEFAMNDSNALRITSDTQGIFDGNWIIDNCP